MSEYHCPSPSLLVPGNAILAVNPDLLILVQGIEWGVNLQAVALKPIQLAVKNRLVYAVVQFTNDPAPNAWFTAATFPKNLIPLWNLNYGFIVKKQIAPVRVALRSALLLPVMT